MNVISIGSIEIAALTAAGRAQRKAVATWLARALQRHIRKDPRYLAKAKTRYLVEQECARNDKCRPRPPQELKRKFLEAFERGEDLYVFRGDGPECQRLLADASSVVDWLDAVPEWDRHLKRIDRMSYAEASKLAEAWHEKLMRLAADEHDPDVVEELETAAELDGGWRIVELKGPVALLREGRKMSHCVGGRGYVEAVAKGRTRIFSLRDPRNEPHVTIEVRRGYDGTVEAWQIKGKLNRAPLAEYAARVRPFVVARNWRVSYDGNNIGLVTVGGRTYADADDILNALLDDVGAAEIAKVRVHGLSRLFEKAPVAQLILTSRLSEVTAASRERLFAALAPRPSDLATSVEETMLRGPRGVVERRRVVLPSAFVQALSLGFFVGMEDRVADVVKRLLEAAVARIAAEPGHVWSIAMTGHATGAAMIEQVAAFAGLAKKLHETRDAVRAARSALVGDMVAAIRRETSRGDRGGRAPEGGWAHQLAMVERLKPAAVEKLGGNAEYLM